MFCVRLLSILCLSYVFLLYVFPLVMCSFLSICLNLMTTSSMLAGGSARSARYGLNLKSLCQPAILPLSTSFLVPLKNLKDDYSIQGTYQLYIEKHDSAAAFVLEVICQRLSQVVIVECVVVFCDVVSESRRH